MQGLNQGQDSRFPSELPLESRACVVHAKISGATQSTATQESVGMTSAKDLKERS